MTPRPRIYITRKIADPALDRMRETADVILWDEDRPVPREVLLEKIPEADALLCMLAEQIDDELLDRASRLKVISNFAVGYDNIDVDAATRRGIPVGNTPDVLTEATADLAFALLLAAARRLPEAERYVHAGKWKDWSPSLLLGRDVCGATLGIIGLGRIGQAVARRGGAHQGGGDSARSARAAAGRADQRAGSDADHADARSDARIDGRSRGAGQFAHPQ